MTAPAGLQDEGAGGEEQQGLHHRVVGDVQQRGGGGERRADAEDGGDFADLRQRRVGEHALEFLLEQRHDFAVDQRQAAEQHEHQRADVDAGTARSGSARRRRRPPYSTLTMPKMPALVRMPDSGPEIDDGASGWASGSQACRGTKPALTAKPTKKQSGGDRADRGVDVADLVGDDGELEAADLRMHQQDAEVHDVGAAGAHQEVDEAGAQRLRRLFVDDQEVGGPGHQFPEDVEVAELVRAWPDRASSRSSGRRRSSSGWCASPWRM